MVLRPRAKLTLIMRTGSIRFCTGRGSYFLQVSSEVEPRQLSGTLYECELVVIPAGAPRKLGMTRDDLTNISACVPCIQSTHHMVYRVGSLECSDADVEFDFAKRQCDRLQCWRSSTAEVLLGPLIRGNEAVW